MKVPGKKLEKSHKGFRLDSQVIESLEILQKLYPRMSMTDFADISIRAFLAESVAHPKSLDEMVGRYMRGDLDQFPEEFLKAHKKK